MSNTNKTLSESEIKKIADIKLLTRIYIKQIKGEELTRAELLFLYEIENEITGVGVDGIDYDHNPMIKEIKNRRNNYQDLKTMIPFNAKNNLTIDCRGNSEIDILDLSGCQFDCSLDLRNLEKCNRFKGPKRSASVYLDELMLCEELDFGDCEIHYKLSLRSLQNFRALVFPKKSRKIDLSGLKQCEELIVKDCTIGMYERYPSNYYHEEGVDLTNLETGTNIYFENVTCADMNLRNLQACNTITFKKCNISNIMLNSLESFEKIIFTDCNIGCIYLDSINHLRGVSFSNTHYSYLNIPSVTDIEGLPLTDCLPFTVIYKEGVICRNYYDRCLDGGRARKY